MRIRHPQSGLPSRQACCRFWTAPLFPVSLIASGTYAAKEPVSSVCTWNSAGPEHVTVAPAMGPSPNSLDVRTVPTTRAGPAGRATALAACGAADDVPPTTR